jgi:hypothetical protein
VTLEKPKSPPSANSFNLIYVVALLIALVVLIVGADLAAHHLGYALLATGITTLVVVLVTWPLALSLVASRAATEVRQTGMNETMTDRLQQIATLLTMMSEQQLLSDRAKAVAFREKDREALRRAIREEMANKDWDAALVLANGMETEFGYTQEAAQLRIEINSNRVEVVQRQIEETAKTVNDHMAGERWSQAIREAERLLQIYPNEERVKRLPVEIENRRQAVKKRLHDSFLQAVDRHEVDEGIDLLKRLDFYLTPAEAEAMQELVRKLFKDKLNNLKTQFTQAYQEGNSAEALRVAEVIVRDFPNSRIALELKDTMDVLRQRAAGHTEVAAKV